MVGNPLTRLALRYGAMASFNAGRLAVCPPVVAHSRELQASAVEQLNLMPDGAVIAGMLSDDAVMHDHARACHQRNFIVTPSPRHQSDIATTKVATIPAALPAAQVS